MNTIYHKESPAENKLSLGLRLPAHLISWIFHPLFITTYLTGFLLFLHPYAFAGIPDKGKFFVFISILINTAFIPGFAVLLMRFLKLIGSMELPTQKDRIIPLAVTMIFYFWTWYVRLSLPDTSVLFKQLLMGAFMGVCITWMLNIFYKVSMHAVAAGGMVFYILLISYSGDIHTGLYIALAVLLAGIITSSRLILQRHTAQEVYSGFMAGLLSQLIAWAWYHLL